MHSKAFNNLGSSLNLTSFPTRSSVLAMNALCFCSYKELFAILHLLERYTHDGPGWYEEPQDPLDQPAHLLFKSVNLHAL
ncbi:hypothetical protein GOODEAATRI_032888 [Goodea atripinnis]|uniref:Uncharacterized protein n=1 Tax=Goodea atripinnis TaxID=208336 RepID=A0ABV0NQ40_9TELE